MKNVTRALVAFWVAAQVPASAGGEMVTRRLGKPQPAPRQVRPARPRSAPPTGRIARTRRAPVIDGKLNDGAWAQAATLSLDRTLDGTGRAAQPTQVRLGQDGKMLYVGIRCTEPAMDKITARVRGHDGAVWGDDSVEFFLSVGNAYYHFGISAAGGTYDAQAKDKSWDSGLKAAVVRGRGEWSVEVAIPLAKLAGGKMPTAMTGNFNRSRRVTGRLEESAWSPTYSGDSYAPARFGRLLFKAAAEPSRPRPAVAAVKGEAATILACEGGQGVIRFDLSPVPKGAKIYRADLLIFRTAPVTGRDEDALVDIEIRPLLRRFESGRPAGADPPLALRGPWFDRFDATKAVQQWVSGKPNGGFFVKACPRWNAQSTCLDIAYEGRAAKVPPQCTEMKVRHRAGQTFITWKEIEDLAGADDLKWRQLKSILDGLDGRKRLRYCVYRSGQPITAKTLHAAELIAAVRPLSGWNVNGRNVERPIDHLIATEPVLGHGQGNPFGRASPDGQYGVDCPIDRLVIADGGKPLPRGTGLYVHNPVKAGRACYAVVTSVDGVQNTKDFSKANATSEALTETVGPGEPVLQGQLPPGPLWDYPQKRLHYVRWVAEPLGNLPGQYFNWSVGVPTKLGKSAPLELNLHRDNRSYWRTHYRLERDSIVLAPHDFPLQTWWYGYHEAQGTLKSFRQGTIHNYTERRLLSFIDWAKKKWPIDPGRVVVTGVRYSGGTGALHLGLRHPKVFGLVVAGHGMPEMAYYLADLNTARRTRGRFDPLEALWGKVGWGLKTDTGQNVWEVLDLNRRLAELPASAELPMISMTSRREWTPCHQFYALMLKKRHAIVANFTWGGRKLLPVSASSTWPNAIRLDVRRDRLLVAFKEASAEPLLGSNKQGEFNLASRWRADDIVDKPDRCEVTLLWAKLYGYRGKPKVDVTLRRLQKFKVVPGKAYRWTLGKTQRGRGTVGEDGLLTIANLDLTTAASRLVVTAE